ncbi:MAG TPA: helix-turn-helix transcriptional regulator [Sphingobium sp.]|nr:helix-turn-helix transcriptional regulator [Sphingobium sp.]
MALFALKGCDAQDIAELRGAAAGTVRAQLTRVYAKAGVGSQSSLVALFLEELIDPNTIHRSIDKNEEAST